MYNRTRREREISQRDDVRKPQHDVSLLIGTANTFAKFKRNALVAPAKLRKKIYESWSLKTFLTNKLDLVNCSFKRS